MHTFAEQVGCKLSKVLMSYFALFSRALEFSTHVILLTKKKSNTVVKDATISAQNTKVAVSQYLWCDCV